MARELILGLDLDGVVFDYIKAVRQYFSKSLGVDPKSLKDPHKWSFVESGWPIKDENHFVDLHCGAVAQGMFAQMETLPGASQTLWELSDAGVYIRVVTHRLIRGGMHAASAGDTVQGLERANIPYKDLTFVTYKPDVGADVYIDDAPHNIEQLRAAGKHAIVFDQPYNQHVSAPRARNWDEAYDLIGTFAQANGLRWDAEPVRVDGAYRVMA